VTNSTVRDLRTDLEKLQEKEQVSMSLGRLKMPISDTYVKANESDKALGYDVSPDEIAGLVSYLVSKEAGSITGTLLSLFLL
jgi:NAD(P)-dependent dehydrogenase (short-subunit alcohol dehydrogenase family)